MRRRPSSTDLLLRHAARIEREIAAQHTRFGYLRAKAALWDEPITILGRHEDRTTSARELGATDVVAEREAQKVMVALSPSPPSGDAVAALITNWSDHADHP